MFNKFNISFNKTDCLSEQMLKDYQAGLLHKDKIRLVELHLADCEMCSDFVEGLSLLSNNELESETYTIINQIQKKSSKKNKIWLYATAASLFIAIAFTTLILILPTKTKYIADNTIKTSEKSESPEELNQQITLSLKKDDSKTAVSTNEISGKEQKKIIEKVAVVENKEGKGEVNFQENFETNIGNYKAEMSGEVTSQVKIEQDQTVVLNNIITTDDERKVAAGDVVTKVPLKSETTTAKVLAEENLESQARKEDENVSLLANTESVKDKKSEEKTKERASKNAPVTVEQNSVNAGATIGGFVDKVSALDDADYYLSKQKTDSAIVLALRGANSTNDSIKWKSKLLLAKAYLANGDKEKAVAIFNEIKKNSKGRFKKDAQKELEKLGF